jgi:hypothetical protein
VEKIFKGGFFPVKKKWLVLVAVVILLGIFAAVALLLLLYCSVSLPL